MHSDRFYKLIANAAPAKWRLDERYFAPMNNAFLAKDRFERFKKATATNDLDWLRWLSQTNQTDASILKSLDDVRYIADELTYPEWAKFLNLFISNVEGSVSIESLNQACNRLTENLFKDMEFLTSNARADLSSALTKRIYRTIWQTAFTQSWASWDIYLEACPAIAYQLGFVVAHFIHVYKEALDRYAADIADIQTILFPGYQLKHIDHLLCDLGDPHNSGRNVIIFVTVQQKKVVYKPKNLLGSSVYLNACKQCSSENTAIFLHHRKILLRDQYAWEEYVQASVCESENDFKSWFFSLGQTQRLLELFGGKDFWSDNFIATSLNCAPIDLETLLQPSFVREFDDAHHQILRRYAAGPLASGLIYMPMQSAGEGSLNLAVFTPRQKLSTPLLDSSGKKIQYELPPYIASTGVREANPFSYEAEFKSGYECLSKYLLNDAVEKLGGAQSLELLAFAPQRFIWRSTWDYYLLLDELSAPHNVKDGVQGCIHLQKIYRALRKAGLDSNLAVSLASCEIKSLLDRDIPFFQLIPSTNAVLFSDENIATIDGPTTFSQFQERLNLESSFDLKSSLSQIHSGIAFSRRIAHQIPFLDYSFLESKTVTLKVVEDIGRLLCDSIVFGANDSVGILSAVYDHRSSNWYLGPLPNVGYSGLAGIAFTLAELYTVTGIAEFRNIARKIVKQTILSLNPSPDSITLEFICGALVYLDDKQLTGEGNLAISKLQSHASFNGKNIPPLNSFGVMINTAQTPIPWLYSGLTTASMHAHLTEIDGRINTGNFTLVDLVGKYEYLSMSGHQEAAKDVMEICYANYYKGYLGGLIGISPEHAPCAVLGSAALIRMYLRSIHEFKALSIAPITSAISSRVI